MTLKKLLYSRTEAAQKLGISTVTLDRLVKHGNLLPNRIGRRVTFSPWQLETFVTRRTQVTQ
jgi:excisionase family DNA binding protein